MGKVFLFASGKGGVGKSSAAASLGVEFARSHLRTALIDGDIGLRSLDLMLGMQDRVVFELTDCGRHLCSLDEALTPHPRFPLLHLLVGGQAARPKDIDIRDIGRIMGTLKNRYDMLLVDCPAGLGRGLNNFVGAADELILVATPDDVCLRDTEKTGRILFEKTSKRPHLLINRYDRRLLRRGSVKPPEAISAALDLPLMGVFEDDSAVYRAMLSGRTMAECGSGGTQNAVRRVAGRMLGAQIPFPRYKTGALPLLRRRFGREGALP